MYVTRRFLRSTMLPSSPTIAADSSKGTQGMSRNPQELEGDEATSNGQNPRRQLRVRATKSEANASSLSQHTGDSAAHATNRQASPHTQKVTGAASPKSKADGVKTEQQGKAKRESASKGSVDASSTQYTGYGILVDARDAQERWCEAKIIGLDAPKKRVFVHYVGWNARYDTWIAVSFLAAHGSHTGDVDKTANSWNGKASLFAPASAARVKKNEAAFHKRKTARSSSGSHSSSSHKKKSLPSPRATSGAKRRARESPAREKEENQEPPKGTDDEGSEEAAPVAKRAKWSANSAVKMEVKAEVVGSKVNSKEKKQSKQAKSQRKTELNELAKVHPVRVVVATTDAISERRSRRNRKQQNVDMELDMDIQCGESPRFSLPEVDDNEEEEEAEEEESDEEEKPSRAKRKAASKASKTSTCQSPRPKAVDDEAIADSPTSAVTSSSRSSKQGSISSGSNGKMTKHEMKKKHTSTKGHSSPPAVSSISRSASSSVDPASALATKEKLAAIFRLRLHQKQMVGGSTPTRSMQEELMHAASSPPPASPAPPMEMDPESVYAREVAAREAYIHYQNAQQLQQYYYQQALLASENMHMQEAAEGMNSSDGEAAHELQGGIMDPRIIHARMSALEIQRQQLQQQQQQQQALLSRQRNLQTFASTQAFLEDSGRAWQEQTKQSQMQATSDEGQQERRQPEAIAASGENGSEPPKLLLEKPQTNAAASASPEMFEVVAADASSESNDSNVSSKEKGADSTPVAAPVSASKAANDQVASDSGSKSSTSACVTATPQADDGGVLYEFVL